MKSSAYAPVLKPIRGGRPKAGQMASHWTSHTMKVTLKSHIHQPLFLQSLDPIWAYSLNADYLNQIQIRSSSLKTTASLVLISSKVLKSFPIPPLWTWRLFGSGVEFIHGLKLVQIAMCGDENSVSKDLWKCPTSFLASLPVSHQARFCNTLCNLILEPIWKKSQKNDGKLSKNHWPTMGHFILSLLGPLEVNGKNQFTWKFRFCHHWNSEKPGGIIAYHFGGEVGEEDFKLFWREKKDFNTRFKSLIWGDSHLLNFNQKLKAK